MVSTFPVYIISVVFAGVFLLLAALISNGIKYEGGANPKDPAKRKMWFWVLAVLSSFSNLLFGLMSYYYPENNTYAKSQLISAIGISSGLCLILYVLLGFLVSKMFKNGKLGNWF